MGEHPGLPWLLAGLRLLRERSQCVPDVRHGVLDERGNRVSDRRGVPRALVRARPVAAGAGGRIVGCNGECGPGSGRVPRRADRDGKELE